MKIMSVIGARPQFVKEAIVQKEINDHEDIQEVVVHTGQHYDNNMSGIFFDVLDMREPDYNLNVKSSTHGKMTAEMMIKLEEVMIDEEPDVVLLYGDTNSTLAGALVASKLKIKVAHIEAGLRQNPKDMPEEINRVLTDHSSEYLFTPSLLGTETLKSEGISSGVHFVGDVMYDIFRRMEKRFEYQIFNKLNLIPNEYIVMTLHRDFNVDKIDVLSNILSSVNEVSKRIKVVFPMHPRTRMRIKEFELENIIKDIMVIDPIDYLNLMGLTKNAYKVITDSGGYQKEAYFAGKEACILMPDTGWRELIENDINKLVTYENLSNAIFSNYNTKKLPGLYGDGDAAKKIIAILKEEFYG